MAWRRLGCFIVLAAACSQKHSDSGGTAGQGGAISARGGNAGAPAVSGGAALGGASALGGAASAAGGRSKGGAGPLGGASAAGASAGGTSAGGASAGAGRAGSSSAGASAGATCDGAGGRGGQAGAGAAMCVGHWKVQHLEDFTSTTLPATAWSVDPVPDDGPFGDEGLYFTRHDIRAPMAYRISQPFSEASWLTLESYTRSGSRKLSDLASVVADPAGGNNKVLRVRSPEHTDATVVRSSAELPSRYRISLRVGYPSFGDGTSDLNGYDSGDETAEPWLQDSAVSENGFYWLTILDSVPRPHNNVWIHHHRKVCIDSDNTIDGWMSVWNGNSCAESGAHPIMMFALDGTSAGSATSGKSFLSYRGGKWANEICAVDAYRAERWYRVSIERFDDRFTLSVSGDFANGGNTTYTSTIDAAASCVFHYNNQGPLPSGSRCSDTRSYSEIGSAYPNWPSNVAYPDYFMFGEPHENFYEGTVYYDDVQLETWDGE